MNDETYRINMKRLALMCLPGWLRRPIAAGLLYAGTAPLAGVLRGLQRFREETGRRVGHNGQTCRLRGVLNDLLDADERRIRVEDPGDEGDREGLCVRLRELGEPVMVPDRGVGVRRLYRRGFGGAGGYDFAVWVPEDLRGIEDRLRGLTEMYKLASKRFEVIYY